MIQTSDPLSKEISSFEGRDTSVVTFCNSCTKRCSGPTVSIQIITTTVLGAVETQTLPEAWVPFHDTCRPAGELNPHIAVTRGKSEVLAWMLSRLEQQRRGVQVKQLAQMFEFIYQLLIFSEYFLWAKDQESICCVSFLWLQWHRITN